MFKLFIALCLFVAIQGQLLPGGFINRPDLVHDKLTQTMVNLAVHELASSQNLRVSFVSVVSVESQVVNGINYRIVFTARSSPAQSVLLCKATVYDSFEGVPSVSSVTCA